MLAHCRGKRARNQEVTPTWDVDFHPTSMSRYTCSWIDRPPGGRFQYKTLSSTHRISRTGTEGFHIYENSRVVNVFRLSLLFEVVTTSSMIARFHSKKKYHNPAQ